MPRSTNELSLDREAREILRENVERRTKATKDGCLLWQGAVNCRTGVPCMSIKGRLLSLNRCVYLLKTKKSTLSAETSVKTTCAHPNCLNPEHLIGVLARFQMLKPEDALKKSASYRQSVKAIASQKVQKEKRTRKKAEAAPVVTEPQEA